MKNHIKLGESKGNIFRENGNYLITGGMGALGYIFAQYIAKSTSGVLILTGRKELNGEMKERFQKLKEINENVLYFPSDIAQEDDVHILYQKIKSTCGQIHGIIHSAGIIKDSFFIQKDIKNFENVLSVKVDGCRYLDEAFSDEVLDFFVMFSSISSVFGNIGQSDYSYANRYMDSYAEYREQLRKQGLRSGKTVSINWPLWDVGMKVNGETRAAMENGEMQMQMLKEEEGIKAFEDALMQPFSQFIVIKGDEDGIDRMLNINAHVDVEKNQATQTVEASKDELVEKVKKFIKEIISQHTKVPIGKIKDTEQFEHYGIDSITIMAISSSIEKQIGRISKTLFYEYENVEELTDFLSEIKKDEFIKLFGINDNKEVKDDSSNKDKIISSEKTIEYPLKNWFEDIKVEQVSNDDLFDTSDIEEIAIIGISGRYPMADDIYEFWNNLINEKDCIEEIPKHRWDHSKYFDENRGTVGKTYAKWGGFINDVEMFDPMFFKIPPIEAEFLDPHERILLETVWEAVEDAGYTIKTLKNDKVGVFVGLMYSLYQLYETEQYGGKMNGRSSLASVANRISYLFDFKGPSIALDTMCSSALTALNLACESIKNNTSTVAVVGGVNLTIHPSKYIQLSQGNFLSSDGRCRSFGEGGDGYVPGEGSGVIVIKSLEQAKKDGDHIYGVIRGISLNAGGKTSGYTVPNLNAQRDLILETLDKSGINPESISTVEAHGTGTSLGDPIEIEALSQAYAKYNVPRQNCSIGSVKSNIGHLEAASGMASITKVLLEMQYKKLVPSLHSSKPNPFIDFEDTPFYIQHKTEDWNRIVIDGKEVPRRAAISAFGAGGSNAHIIVEEYENADLKDTPKSKDYLFLLSAKNENRLKEYSKKLRNFLEMSILEEKTQSKDSGIILKNVLDAVASVLRVSSESLDQDDLLCEIGIDKYAVEQIKEILLEKYPDSIIESEILISCKTISDIVNQIANVNTDLCLDNSRVKTNSIGELSLERIAYTLQVGREAMEQRLAIVAADVNTLISSLKAYETGEKTDNYKTGNIKFSDGKFDSILSNKMFIDNIMNELKQGRYNEAAEVWVIGADISWENLYEEDKPQKISLPTYPFAKERCWIIKDDGTGCLFPYLAENKPTIDKASNIIERQERIDSNKNISNHSVTKGVLSENLEKETINYLKLVFSDVLKIQYEYLDEEQTYDEYGIDSIYINNLNQYLTKQFGELPSTLFFTYKNIRLLAKYFINEHKDKLFEILSMENIQDEIVEEVKVETDTYVKPEISFENRNSNDIAIIGISGRFPKSEGLEEYFENLRQGKDCIESIPKDRWNYEDFPDIQCKWGGFLNDIDKFDPQFFGIAPVVASFMDPQERIFLEAVWSCLEDAGYTPKSMESHNEFDSRGNVAVYAGVTFNEYGLYGAEDIARGKTTSLNSQIYSIANRISYLFNFGGPSLSVDTACSSSLYAIHLACNSLLTGDADMAIAGGVNLMLHPSKYITLNWGNFLSSDGRCHTFGNNGDGYVPGEGTGAVLLKPLWKAQQDNDHIYAVIKGSAVNHGGKTHGYSVPNPVAQSDVIDKALKKSGINPRTISYIEAHGTGTALGDPIEVQALTDVYKKYTKDLQYCPIGSVKSNIGHLEAAAGVSQLLKVILQMKNEELVPSRLNSDRINPNLNFNNTPFYVQLQNEKWKRPCIDGIEYPRRAGISAFGVGGVNVHVIVEEYIEENQSENIGHLLSKVIIPFSAKTEQALNRYLVKFLKFIREKKDLCDLRDVAYTLSEGRIESMYRVAFVVSSFEELESKIEKALAGLSDDGIYTGRVGLQEQQNNKKKLISDEVVIQDINKVAGNWVKGMIMNNLYLDKDYQPKKISLPTYSFEREAYWMYSKVSMQKNDKEIIPSVEEVDKKIEGKSSILSKLKETYENERLELTITHIQSLFAEVLCFPEGKLPNVEEGFFSLGLESVMTRKAMVLLEDEFLVSLDEQIFFNYSNITDLSKYILTNVDLDAEINKEEVEAETIYAQEVWSDIENISFTESFGRGDITIISASEKIKMNIHSRFCDEILEKVTFAETSEDFANKVNNGFIPNKIVFLEGLITQEHDKPLDVFVQEKLENIMQALKPVLTQGDKQIFVYYFYLNKNDAHSAVLGAVNGLLKSLMLEYPNILTKTIDISQESENEKELVEIVANEIKVGCIDSDIRYAQGTRQTRKLVKVVPKEDSTVQFRENGVYLITGGLGSVGKELSKHLCKKYNANLILCGRSTNNTELNAQIQEIEMLGGKVEYVQTDVSNSENVKELVKYIKKSYNNINGVVHLAGNINNDVLFVAKTIEDMDKVITPKVLGTYYLDQELADEELDFFMMFSAVSSVFGNASQSDFCFANRYLDCFADLREVKVSNGIRKGKSIAINWSFWKAEGSMMDEVQERLMEKQFGMLRMEKENGITAIEDSLKIESKQLILLNGNKQKLCETLGVIEEDNKQTITEQVELETTQNDEDALDELLNDEVDLEDELLKLLMQEIDE
ncbi:MAG: SDR family NAD(P)-dependent oxidoreductase [Acutalibacteraceae bacterium]|nr:SDR family NAD(P)-dependent oxidoreductase [Acutalibacteraceae bacterium]